MRLNQTYRIVPNILSCARIILGISYSFLLNHYCSDLSKHEEYFLFLIFFVILLSDVLDGFFARIWHVESYEGAILDVCADSVYIFSSYFVLNVHGILPVWFTIAIILKLIEFSITSKLIRSSEGKTHFPFLFDLIGRIASACYFVLPGFILLLLKLDEISHINLMIFALILLTLLSSFLRLSKTIYPKGKGSTAN